jgi:hypothetical protein
MVRRLLSSAAMPARPPVPAGKFLTVRPDRVAPVFASLPVEVRALLRLCDGTRTLRALREETRLPRRIFEEVITRLVTLGYVGAGFPRPSDWGRVLAWARDPGQPLPMPSAAEPEAAPPAQDLMAFEPTVLVDFNFADFTLEEEAFFARTIDHLLEPEERGPSLH